jgi:hypothetical protein
MACQKCATNKSSSCACQSTSYTIPENAVYGDSTCKLPAEPCESVTCTECVRHCHSEDKWCVKYPTVTGSVLLCMHKGERLDQFLQKMALAHYNAETYPYMVKSFYADHVTGASNPTIKFIWYDFLSDLEVIKLEYRPQGTIDWQVINAFANINPLTTNTFTLDSTMATLFPGTTYEFRLVTQYDGIVYAPGSVVLSITIPTA